MEKESGHKKKSAEEYSSFIRHELSHSFFTILAKGGSRPKWLWEGVSICTSGQILKKKKPEKFDSFLKYYNEGGEGVYKESGFAVELLVIKFGKQKLLDLIKSLKDVKSEDNFNEKFYEIYGFKPTYEEFNKLFRS